MLFLNSYPFYRCMCPMITFPITYAQIHPNNLISVNSAVVPKDFGNANVSSNLKYIFNYILFYPLPIPLSPIFVQDLLNQNISFTVFQVIACTLGTTAKNCQNLAEGRGTQREPVKKTCFRMGSLYLGHCHVPIDRFLSYLNRPLFFL